MNLEKFLKTSFLQDTFRAAASEMTGKLRTISFVFNLHRSTSDQVPANKVNNKVTRTTGVLRFHSPGTQGNLAGKEAVLQIKWNSSCKM